MIERDLLSEASTIAFGQRLAKHFLPGLKFYFKGVIGAGKTTLIRALLRELGVKDKIKSPTFSLLETYQLEQGQLAHYDFYRLSSPCELEFIDWQTQFEQSVGVFVEWPEMGEGELVTPDCVIELIKVQDHRRVKVTSGTKLGERFLAKVSA